MNEIIWNCEKYHRGYRIRSQVRRALPGTFNICRMLEGGGGRCGGAAFAGVAMEGLLRRGGWTSRRVGAFQLQRAAVQRPCGRHVLRAFEEQKEAQCDWGVEKVELTSLLQIEAVYF